jgi:D-amino-acid dehydrogenase
VTPVDDMRIRIAGTAEFGGFDADVRSARIENLMSLLAQIYPDLARGLRIEEATSWAGLRPMSPDGVPIISRTPIRNLYLNTGHGHVGWTCCAGSARLLADLIEGAEAPVEAADYALARFHGGGRRD